MLSENPTSNIKRLSYCDTKPALNSIKNETKLKPHLETKTEVVRRTEHLFGVIRRVDVNLAEVRDEN